MSIEAPLEYRKHLSHRPYEPGAGANLGFVRPIGDSGFAAMPSPRGWVNCRRVVDKFGPSKSSATSAIHPLSTPITLRVQGT